MNKNQAILVNLISVAIRNKSADKVIKGDINWEEIYEEAKKHDVQGLIYPLLEKVPKENLPKGETLQKWKRKALATGMWQLQLLKELQSVLYKFSEADIKVIALKGIVLRELYPYPELRSMGDADILVRPQDIHRAEVILLNMGFYEEARNEEHIEFRNKNNIDIELHWSLIGEGRFKNTVDFEDSIWNNAVESTIFSAPILVLPKDEHLLYIGLHMAKHIISAGFGIRQVCDFVLLYEDSMQDIDWSKFFYRLEQYGLEKFFIILFLVCNKLFGMELPKSRQIEYKKYEKYVLLLINEIFEGGTFGYQNHTKLMGSFVLRGANNMGSSKLQHIKVLLFPNIDNMGEKYWYAKRFRILIPLAWLHRLVSNVFRKDFTLSEKLYFPKEYNKRSDLLGWLDIK